MVKLTPQGKESLDALVAALAEGQTIPGFVVGATTAEEEIYINAGGHKVVGDSTSGKVEKDSVFWICSQSKLITHIAALQLIEQGKLKEETPVSDYFPQFENTVIVKDIMSPNPTHVGVGKVAVRVKHLLNFTSGLFYPFGADSGTKLSDAYTAAHDMKNPHSAFFDIVKGDLPGIPLNFEPGTDFAYGYSSDVLGFIVEKISGKTLDQYMQENIFKPLGIKGSFYLTPDVKDKLLPLSIRRGEKLETWTDQAEVGVIERDPTKVSCHLGGVGLYMSLRDYLTLLRHLLQINAGNATNPILKAETVQSLFVPTLSEAGNKSLSMFTNFTKPPVAGASWSNAFALTSVDWPNCRKKGSGFWSGWAGTHFWIDPTTGVAAVFGTQLICSFVGACDPDVLQCFSDFEKALYAGLI